MGNGFLKRYFYHIYQLFLIDIRGPDIMLEHDVFPDTVEFEILRVLLPFFPLILL